MTPEQFCYWLNGFAELHQQTPTTAQWVAIMQHLDTVFKKVTPPLQVGPARAGMTDDEIMETIRKSFDRKPADAWPPIKYPQPSDYILGSGLPPKTEIIC